MFRIECFVEDRHLAEVMHGLAGRARDLKVVPVANAKPDKKDKVVPVVQGDMTDTIAKRLAKLDVFSASDVKSILKSLGRSPNSVTYYLKALVGRGTIVKVPGTKGAATRYTTVKS